MTQKQKKSFLARLRAIKEKFVYILLSPYRVFKLICFSIGFAVILVFTGFSIYLYSVLHSGFDIESSHFDLLKKVARKIVYERLENKEVPHPWTSIEHTSREYLHAIVMSEDSTFFQHDGLNFGAMADALAENIKKRRYAYGASTISQQVVKNLFLTSDKTLTRKIQEMYLTRKLEEKYDKNQILELYLNLAEFGPDIFGIAAASYRYFQKPPSEINAAEAAYIALMLPSPRKNYHILYVNQSINPARKRKILRILRDMMVQEYITPEQFQSYRDYAYFPNGSSVN